MVNITIYTKSYCPYSQECKKFLDEKGVVFDDLQIDHDTALTKEMETKSGRPDTPQVFINGKHIGSFDDLKALDSTGTLNELLNI